MVTTTAITGESSAVNEGVSHATTIKTATKRTSQQIHAVTTTAPPSGYYEKGSVELALETPVMMERLEKRRRLTGTGANDGAECLLVVLVGLPARGKSFIARKLLNTLTWRGNQCRIFNVGKYRRRLAEHDVPPKKEEETQPHLQQNNLNNDDDAAATTTTTTTKASTSSSCKADFFDDSNQEAARLRQEAAALALEETLDWLDGEGGISDTVTLQPSSSTGSCLDLLPSTTAVEDLDVTSGLESHPARRQFHRIAIYDATNSTKERRSWILTECAKRTERNAAAAAATSASQNSSSNKRIGVLFLESICDDPELLAENFRVKISSCPDFDGMTQEEALQDLQTRIQKYESRYETIDEQAHKSYIKIFNLSSRLMVNHVYGRLAKVVLPAIMAWNTGSRPIFLCRAGETAAMEAYMKQQQDQPSQKGSNGNDAKTRKFEAMMERKRSDRLGKRGLRFRDALCEFIEKEGNDFMNRRNETVMHPSRMDTGTSISGLYEERDHSFAHQSTRQKRTSRPRDDSSSTSSGSSNVPSFPCLVMSSTMPRAVETATWRHMPFPVKDVSNLNPLDMGDFSGMDLETIRQQYPEWYEQLEREPFYTRFPGGESYSDLIDRLYSIVIDMEQQLGLAVVVSHVSVLQVLVSYFRGTPIRECMDIEIPMHTVMKFTPLRGGGWLETQHALLPDDGPEMEPNRIGATEDVSKPIIWGDSRSCLPQKLS